MRIRFRIPAHVRHDETDKLELPPESLHGMVFETDLADHLDYDLADVGVRGGVVHAELDDRGLPRIVVDYWSPTALDEDQLDRLSEEVSGQMSDGAGENGFPFKHEGGPLRLFASSWSEDEYPVEQSDDGRAVAVPPQIPIAARNGDLAAISAVLASGEPVDVLHLGYTGLHYAIFYGHIDVAFHLIEKGADPNHIDKSSGTPLFFCASRNSLDEDDSIRVAKALLASGADPRRRDSGGWTAADMARNHGKLKLAAVLESEA